MIKKNRRMLVLVGCFLLAGSCDFIFEEDLSSEEVQVIMPLDGSVSTFNYQVFWWEELDAAIKYNIQMVEGSFAVPLGMVADTNVSGNLFEISLPTGEYEWRIRAWNNFSETLYFSQSFTIADSTYEE